MADSPPAEDFSAFAGVGKIQIPQEESDIEMVQVEGPATQWQPQIQVPGVAPDPNVDYAEDELDFDGVLARLGEIADSLQASGQTLLAEALRLVQVGLDEANTESDGGSESEKISSQTFLLFSQTFAVVQQIVNMMGADDGKAFRAAQASLPEEAQPVFEQLFAGLPQVMNGATMRLQQIAMGDVGDEGEEEGDDEDEPS